MRLREWLGVGERRWKKARDEEVQPGKTLWDWLQLLIVPAILIGLTFAWSGMQARSDNKREDRRIAADRATAEEAREDATLQGYLNEISGLMLDKKLLTSDEGDAVRAVARTVTLTVLRRLDGERKGEVVRFLHESGLLDPKPPEQVVPPAVNGPGPTRRSVATTLVGANVFIQDPRVSLKDADLRGADLEGADLDRANLEGSNLMGANLNHASLFGSKLEDADLTEANLGDLFAEESDLEAANLTRAKLTGADLRGANLIDSNLKGADLEDANLKNAGLLCALHLDPAGARDLDLNRFLSRQQDAPGRKRFLREQWSFLMSLSPRALADYRLSRGKLTKLRRETPRPTDAIGGGTPVCEPVAIG